MIAIFPEINSCVSSGNIEKLAVLVRLYFAGEQARNPSIQVGSLIADFGIQISEKSSSDLASMLVIDERGEFRISFMIAQHLLPSERSFLLAHMLGHFLFDVQPKIAAGESLTIGYREDISPLLRYEKNAYDNLEEAIKVQEERADLFAAALLLPKGMFLRAYEKLQDFTRVSRFFAVTPACVERRVQMLMDQPVLVSKNRPKQIVGLYEGHKRQEALADATPESMQPASPMQPKLTRPTASRRKSRERAKQARAQVEELTRGHSALKRIRELAKLIDQSVDT